MTHPTVKQYKRLSNCIADLAKKYCFTFTVGIFTVNNFHVKEMKKIFTFINWTFFNFLRNFLNLA